MSAKPLDRARWAIQRTTEILEAEGLSGVDRRGRHYLRKRRMSRQRRLPMTPIPPGCWPRSVVIVAGPEPRQCYHYRVAQKVEAAEALGVPVRVVDPAHPGDVSDAVQLASVVILFRQGINPGTRAALNQAHRLGVPVVYEADDAVYRRDLLTDNPNLATVPRSLRRAVVTGADDHRELLKQCDHVLASTAVLAADMGRHVPGSQFVIDNGIDEHMARIVADLAHDPAPPRGSDDHRIIIGYGSGSRAHDSDLAVAASGLSQVMADDSRVHVVLVGPLRLPDQLHPFVDRVQTYPELGYPEFLRQLSSWDIAIAPLLDLPFNRFKSQVKYLEAALAGVPLVASPTVYADYVHDGTTAVIARDGQWGTALASLVADPELRAALARGARADVAGAFVDQRPKSQLAALLAAVS